jgi:hypothetical protein
MKVGLEQLRAAMGLPEGSSIEAIEAAMARRIDAREEAENDAYMARHFPQAHAQVQAALGLEPTPAVRKGLGDPIDPNGALRRLARTALDAEPQTLGP